MKKMTKARLKGYQRLKLDIACLEHEIRAMEETDSGMGHSVILDYRKGYPRPQSVTGFDWKRYEQKQDLLVRKKAEAAWIESWIAEIEDGQVRYVFSMRYIENLSWKNIAKKIGIPQNEDYPRLVIRDKYLKKMEIK